MDSRVFSVYNLARGVFLSSKVTAADGVNEPLKILKVLVSGLGLDTESALWICPLSAIPAVPRLFPFDLLYLDRNQRVVDLVEIVPGGEFPPYRREVASALILARRTLESTKTGRGDRLIIGVAEEIEREIAAADAFDLEPMVANSRSTAGKMNGFFDKNGREARPAVSAAVLTEPFSPVVARLAESPVPATEPAGTRALAIESSANQSAADQAVGEIESEDRISASSQTEPAGVERDGVSAANPTEDPELARLVSEAVGLSAGTAEKSIQTADSNSTGQVSSAAKDAIPGDKLTTSILEADMEKENGNRLVITGQHGGVEDLFSNWVDAPSLTSAWMPRNPRPGSTAPTPPMPSAFSPDKGQSEAGSKASCAVQSKPAEEPKKAASNIAAVPPKSAIQLEKSQESATAAKNTTTSVPPPVPAKTAVPQPHQATTFTAGTLGMWRVTMPTAVSPLGAVQSSDQTRPAAPLTGKESPSGKETNAKENPAPVAKSANFQTEASTASSRVTRASELPKAAESSVAANLEKIPARESATGSRERLAEKMPEKTERPAPTTAGAALDKVQPDSHAAKAGVSADSVAAAPKQVKVESKAIVPANGTAPKAQPKPSNAGTGANGKSKIAPPSLGMRFKRWLNPVAPVAGDRRRAHRRYVPGMVAHYYTGGAPTPHEVADISLTGFYLLTEDRWMPETMIQMSLQKPCAKGERKQCITVLSKIVRRGSDGVAAQFVMPEDLNPLSHDVQPSQATDKFSLARFL